MVHERQGQCGPKLPGQQPRGRGVQRGVQGAGEQPGGGHQDLHAEQGEQRGYQRDDSVPAPAAQDHAPQPVPLCRGELLPRRVDALRLLGADGGVAREASPVKARAAQGGQARLPQERLEASHRHHRLVDLRHRPRPVVPPRGAAVAGAREREHGKRAALGGPLDRQDFRLWRQLAHPLPDRQPYRRHSRPGPHRVPARNRPAGGLFPGRGGRPRDMGAGEQGEGGEDQRQEAEGPLRGVLHADGGGRQQHDGARGHERL
mmetsp:Transcript_10099/g.23607  ORF Transcript_10099/g.23607 Transcript_10099/m.23607 type:complete len:260 (+) Transcript_10099:1691-2470(+)